MPTAPGAKNLARRSVDEALLGVVEPDGSTQLYRAGPGSELNDVEILGHADLLRAGFVSQQAVGFSLFVRNGRVTAFVRNSSLNAALHNMNLPSEMVQDVLAALGAKTARVYGY